MDLYSVMTEEITAFTGLSPAAFFTILAMMVVVYRTVSGMFVCPEDYNKPPVITAPNNLSFGDATNPTSTRPVQLGDMTEQELRAYNGSDPNKPLLIAIKGQIYDVSSSRMFYGPGGAYSMFAGKEASRALALLSFKPEDINGNLEDLGESELAILEDWEFKFVEKYAKVGQLVPRQNIEKNKIEEKIRHQESHDQEDNEEAQ